MREHRSRVGQREAFIRIRKDERGSIECAVRIVLAVPDVGMNEAELGMTRCNARIAPIDAGTRGIEPVIASAHIEKARKVQRDSAEPASHIEHAVVRFQVGDGSHILEMTASERFEFSPPTKFRERGGIGSRPQWA
jgi:hypothetical protein